MNSARGDFLSRTITIMLSRIKASNNLKWLIATAPHFLVASVNGKVERAPATIDTKAIKQPKAELFIENICSKFTKETAYKQYNIRVSSVGNLLGAHPLAVFSYF